MNKNSCNIFNEKLNTLDKFNKNLWQWRRFTEWSIIYIHSINKKNDIDLLNKNLWQSHRFTE